MVALMNWIFHTETSFQKKKIIPLVDPWEYRRHWFSEIKTSFQTISTIFRKRKQKCIFLESFVWTKFQWSSMESKFQRLASVSSTEDWLAAFWCFPPHFKIPMTSQEFFTSDLLTLFVSFYCMVLIYFLMKIII